MPVASGCLTGAVAVVSPLQMGKVHFGVLLGWSVVQSVVLWFMVNQIASNEAAEHRALDLYSCCCIVGYGMVPLLVLSVAVLFTPRWGGCVALCVGVAGRACRGRPQLVAGNSMRQHRTGLQLKRHCCCLPAWCWCRGPVSAVLAILAAAWSAVTAAKILSKVSHALAEVQALVMMPCFLLYGSFALLTVY